MGISRAALVALLLLFMFLVGCDGSPDPAASQSPIFQGQEITIGLLEDAGLAQVLDSMRGEWQAQTGAILHVTQHPWPEDDGGVAAQLLSGGGYPDVLIYPPSAFGDLAAEGALLPLSKQTLADPVLAWRDVLDALRGHQVRWAEEVLAVPLGSPVLVAYLRRDLLEARGLRPPQTWGEYLELAHSLSAPPPDVDPQSWHAVAEPLGPGARRTVFLSRAASYAKHPYNYSFFFKIDTMQSLIASDGFVEALEDLLRVVPLAPPDVLEYHVSDARRAFWSGSVAMALAWETPRSGDVPRSDEGDGSGEVTRDAGFVADFAEMPGRRRVFNPSGSRWETLSGNRVNHVPYFGATGWLASVCANSAHQQAAVHLLTTAAGKSWGSRLASASSRATVARTSQLDAPGRWVAPFFQPAEAGAYVGTVASAMNRDEVVLDLRIPGRERYYRALDAALERALTGKQQPTAALEQAAEEWRSITEALGLDAQRAHYERSLGLIPAADP